MTNNWDQKKGTTVDFCGTGCIGVLGVWNQGNLESRRLHVGTELRIFKFKKD
jgi:hypothetical protein